TAVNDLNPNELKYPIRESVAYLTLWSNIKSPNALGLGLKMSSDLWGHLETEFMVVSKLLRKRKEDSLWNCRYTGGGITGNGGYAEKICSLYKDATDAGATISDEQLIILFVNSFPRSPKWEFVWLMNGSNSGGIKGMDKVSALQTEVKHLKKQIVAMQVRKGPVNPGLKCTNPNCNCVGHVIENCFRKSGGKEGQYPCWWKGEQDNATSVTANATANASSS
ncbi:hypothetical protein K435DRAFT_573455, partial [Dendrothele bispora CBS 962.96]